MQEFGVLEAIIGLVIFFSIPVFGASFFANKYKSMLKALGQRLTYQYFPGVCRIAGEKVSNYYTFPLPILRMGYLYKQTESFEHYIYLSGEKMVVAHMVQIDKSIRNYEFNFEQKTVLDAANLATGIREIDDNYQLTGRDKTQVISLLENHTEFCHFLKNLSSEKLGMFISANASGLCIDIQEVFLIEIDIETAQHQISELHSILRKIL